MDGELLGFSLAWDLCCWSVCRAQCSGGVMEGLAFLLSDVLCLRGGSGGKW